MRYAQIRVMDISNGEGIGVALFVQGCHFHCKNCFNPETWDFKGGEYWDENTEEYFLSLISNPHIKRVTILGGEPLCDENVSQVYELLKKIIHRFGNTKKIWVYTGYELEDIISHPLSENPCRTEVLSLIDVLVDGRYIDELKSLQHKWVGSTNQRVIDLKKSIEQDEIVLYQGVYDKYGKTNT